MKDARWLPVIGTFNLGLAVASVFGFARWFAPRLALSLTPFFLFRLSLAALAVATGTGLWMRRDWARRWSIVLWAVAMTLGIPVAVLGGIRFGVTGVIAALVVAVGTPMLVISYLSQPNAKLAVGAADTNNTGRRTIAFVVAGMSAGLVVIALLVNELMKAIGQGLR